MVDVNNCTRKRRNDTSDVNEDEVSTSTLQPSTVENSEPATKMVKSENVTDDTETLSQNDVASVDIKRSDNENLVILQEENLKLTNDLESPENVHLNVCNNNINGNINNVSNSIESDPNHHIITIKFHNPSIAENYKNKFLHFLKTIKEFSFVNVSSDLEIKISKNGHDSKDNDVHSGENSRKRKRKKSKTADLFIVDKTPSGESADRLELKYTSKYSVQIEEKLMNTARNNNASLCFNCNKNHNLRDCPEPKDYNKINAARMKMKSQQFVKTRYHMEEDQKYSQFSPGKISEHLRDALGIYKDELPPYIYKMRLFGYPPGWLEEAKIEQSNMSLFNIEGKEDYNSKNKVTTNINVDKIVEYPGFNMPIEEGIKDEYNLHDCPPFSNRCSKEAMINFLKESFQKEIDNNETCDMDLDQSTDDSTAPSGCEEVFSPSLTELEKQKLELLAELDGGKYNSEMEEKKDAEKSDNKTDENIDSKIEIVEDNTTNGVIPSSPVRDVKLSVFGTPIFQTTSPYCVLPHPDKFSKDISPVINFENLPNSTGKYEQMSAVIQKVRKTLKDISEKLKP
ncbi:zinc finger CCHC domain-containing protein 8 homolog [Onthophagus taurus]|uniref:zinc finger CCHC domain-containing protein 8 homolog n=1 Tax=Onthophagus taurus TaxID=166361 RepID=UPI000C1FFD1F|nr:zinc finger CCHC domain-containing protein 8 homolog [Onthophagus taurus]